MMAGFQDRWIAGHMLHPRLGGAARLYLQRPFSKRSSRHMAIYYSPNRISFAQVYPFLHYETEFAAQHDIELRAIPVDALLDGERPVHGGADVVLLQPWFTVEPERLAKAMDIIRAAHPQAEISFLDSYAHNDLRLGRYVDTGIRHYLKKSLFHDRQLYLRHWRGDTNLTEYFGDLYSLAADAVDWGTPPALLDKLRLSPNFLTDPLFMRMFGNGNAPAPGPRDIDVHARLGSQGSGWYQAMRRAGQDQLQALSDLTIVSKGSVPLPVYLAELRQSKLCFSPFGYGELCWRDVEAIACGAVLVKPDMSHLETLPNLYEAGVTYLPVAWDLGNLDTVMRTAVADETLRGRISAEAWRRASDYIRTKRFVPDTGFLFSA